MEPSSGTGDSDPATQNAADQVKQQTQQLARHTADQAVDQVQRQAKSLTATQKDKASQTLTTLAQALRQTSQQLSEQEQVTAGRTMDKVGAQLERLACYLESRDVNQIIGGAENVGRRQPALFLGSAFAVGFLASRFLKSSPPDRSTTRDQNMAIPTSDVVQQDEDMQETPEVVSEPSRTLERNVDGTTV